MLCDNRGGELGWEVEGGSRGRGTYVYLWLIHVDVWQKPTQYGKAIILQFKLHFKIWGSGNTPSGSLSQLPLSIPLRRLQGPQPLAAWAPLPTALICAQGFLESPPKRRKNEEWSQQ